VGREKGTEMQNNEQAFKEFVQRGLTAGDETYDVAAAWCAEKGGGERDYQAALSATRAYRYRRERWPGMRMYAVSVDGETIEALARSPLEAIRAVGLEADDVSCTGAVWWTMAKGQLIIVTR